MATRKRPRFVGVWLSEDGYAALQKRAEDENTSLSALLRRILAYARNMPVGWRP